jgi:hypothetical protein
MRNSTRRSTTAIPTSACAGSNTRESSAPDWKTSHILQPSDLGYFSAMKPAYRRKLQLRCCLHMESFPGKEQFIEAYSRVRDTVSDSKHILSGWKATGIFHFSIDIINSFSGEARQPKAGLQNISRCVRLEILMNLLQQGGLEERFRDSVKRGLSAKEALERQLSCHVWKSDTSVT